MSAARAACLAIATILLNACGGTEAEQSSRVALHADEAVAGATLAADPASGTSPDTVVVYKTPTCGCCSKWVDHMREHGFTVVTHDLDNLAPIKEQLGVPVGRVSCHTARVGGYTLEGHVPADLVQRMLDENPRFSGLTVPGMPMGSPGMEGLVKQSYQVLSFDDSGTTEVYAER